MSSSSDKPFSFNIDMEGRNHAETVKPVRTSRRPPSLWHEFVGLVRETIIPWGTAAAPFHDQPTWKQFFAFLQSLFPILKWGMVYDKGMFKSDVMAGLTLASLSIPQSIGYASLAHLDPQYGLYTSVVPPMIYAVMGSSREIAIGPVAVVSLLLSSLVQKQVDPLTDPLAYRKLVFTSTFFAGVFQLTFGLFRLGFLVDFLSHAAIVGFMGGAAIIIGLQQLKGLLGITHFTNKTDVISVLEAVFTSLNHSWDPHSFVLGSAFLIFILATRFIGRKNKKLFWFAAIAPLISVILSTLIVYLTKADKHGMKIIKHFKGGINRSSLHQLEFNSSHVGEAVKIGLISATVALTEAIAVGRSFASSRGYHLDGNKEMVAMGCMNIAGSLSSCYVATGSFSRSAVNFSAGCQTAVSNVVMSVTVIVALELLTRLFYYTPIAILASIILAALPGLIDVSEAHSIWRVDKVDFFICTGAFLGVLFANVEIGLLIAIATSFTRIVVNAIRPGIEKMGRIQGTDIFCSMEQYPGATRVPGTLVVHIGCDFLCFSNANSVRERIMKSLKQEQQDTKVNVRERMQAVIIDMSNIMNVDTTGIGTLQELHKNLRSQGLQLALANPRLHVIHKLKLAKFVSKMGEEWIFLTVEEAVQACTGFKQASVECL